MARRRFGARLTAGALLLPLLALSIAAGGLWMRCRITGALTEACCCAGDDGGGPRVPVVSEADCCDRVVVAASDQASELTAHDSWAAPRMVPVTYTGGGLPAVFAAAHVVAPRAAWPPDTRARLIAKSAFLI
jgi:hypothetical protein